MSLNHPGTSVMCHRATTEHPSHGGDPPRHGHRNPIHCIVPPYVLDAIACNGTPQQRLAAVRTRSIDTSFRSFRLSSPAARAIARAIPQVVMPTSGKRRSIYSAQGTQNLPGVLVRAEGQGPSGDVAVDEAFDGLGATFDFFHENFGRKSIDDEGMPLDATVHFGREYGNAFWNSVQMVFGDGDGVMFNRFTVALDVIGHELSHGVIEDEAQLQYFSQSGALNESVSDVFGTLIKQWHLGQQASEADWLIGAGLFTERVKGDALRSMKAPGTAFDDPMLGADPQPAHMNDFINTMEDNGGVHLNSGIPNHAFYRTAIALGGFAWERAGRIWYDALRDPRLRPNSGFERFASITHEVAQRRYGSGSTEARAVASGWEAVGLTV